MFTNIARVRRSSWKFVFVGHESRSVDVSNDSLSSLHVVGCIFVEGWTVVMERNMEFWRKTSAGNPHIAPYHIDDMILKLITTVTDTIVPAHMITPIII